MEWCIEASQEPSMKFQKNHLFIAIDADQVDHQRILELFGMKKNKVPSIRIKVWRDADEKIEEVI